jgi:hypothetical protein
MSIKGEQIEQVKIKQMKRKCCGTVGEMLHIKRRQNRNEIKENKDC